LSRQGSEDRLADPPNGVGDELHPLVRVELPGRGEETQVSFADEIAEPEAAVLVLLGDRDDEPEIPLDQLLHCVGIAGLDQARDRHLLLRGEQRGLTYLKEILIEDVTIGVIHAKVLCRRPLPAPPGLPRGGLGENVGDRQVIGLRVGNFVVAHRDEVPFDSCAIGQSTAMSPR
jgi:hypothetical protein